MIFLFTHVCQGPRTNVLAAGCYSVDLKMGTLSSLTRNYLLRGLVGFCLVFFGSWSVSVEPSSDSGEIGSAEAETCARHVSAIYKPLILCFR